MPQSIRRFVGVACATALLVPLSAADDWLEIKSTNFYAISNAGERETRTVLWQLEQMRSAMSALWAWVKPDLNKPLTIFMVKDIGGMRTLAPQFWQKGGALRPASVWTTAPDQHYLVLRADVRTEDKETLNPYFTAYFSYVALVLDQSLDARIPYWFRRGFTGVLGNTIVREDRILLGPIVPSLLRRLRDQPPMPLTRLIAVPRNAPEFQRPEFLEDYDAQTWAFVHFVIFGEGSKRAAQLDTFIRLVSSGKEPSAAFAEAFGALELIETGFINYVRRNLFAYSRYQVDMNLQRERFPARPLTVAEISGARSQLHVAMRQPVESRAAIAEARKADPNAAASYVAEALLLEEEGKAADAKVAYAKAVELATTSAFAHYRLAALSWERNASDALLKEIDGLLSKAVARNPRYADAYSWLGELRGRAGSPSGAAFVRTAISLEPREPRHRVRAAYVMFQLGHVADARREAEAALALSNDESARRAADEILALIAKAK